MKHYDTIIIGAGLSGLAAGIRLSHYGQKVLILESHSRAGGLNSYYSRHNREIDAGLHAMTNFVHPGERGAPLTKLLRQLRIRYEELDLVEQSRSTIDFPGISLNFTNDFADLCNEIALKFPSQIDGFQALSAELEHFNETALDVRQESARENISRFISDPLLIDMLFCPLMYYGNPCEGDMDWAHFAVMWRSIFRSGFCRPRDGMKYIINLILDKYAANGGELCYNSQVVNLLREDGRIAGVELEGGKTLTAARILSSAGYCETMRLCGKNIDHEAGQLSFAELVLFLDVEPAALGYDRCITFFSQEETFHFERSRDLLDTSSGVLCCPNNFRYLEPLAEGQLRVTMKAGYNQWSRLDTDEYLRAKQNMIDTMLEVAQKYVPGVKSHIAFTDMFTPLTIERFTGHINGAIYGAPIKNRPATTEYENLFLVGTDQGFLGIVGALLSGITVANLYGLK